MIGPSMFFLRGMSFILSRESVPIVHPWYDLLANYAWWRQADLAGAPHTLRP